MMHCTLHKLAQEPFYGTISVSKMAKAPYQFAPAQIAYVVLDRSATTFQAMDYDDFNFMLVSMIPYLSNLGNREAITPGSKKTILQQLAKAWVSANQRSSDPLTHQTCAFDTRFPHVLEALKAGGAIYARDPATQHLVSCIGNW